MKKTLLLLILLCTAASAQNGTSILARYGIGELQTMATTRTRGMGQANSAAVSETDISYTNPALWAFLQGIRLQGEGTYESETYDKYSGGVRSTQIKGLQLAFPVHHELGIGIVTGFIPVSRAQYKASLVTPAEAVGQQYTTEYLGSGGLSQFRFGASVKPLPSLYIGAAYEYYFGSVSRTANVLFDNTDYFAGMQSRTAHFSGSGAQLGLLYDGLRPVTIGLSVSTPVALRVSDKLDVVYTTQDSSFTGASGTQDLPLRLDAGLTCRITDALNASVEYGFQNWRNAAMFESGATMYNSAKFGVGLEWRVGDRESPFLNQVLLRAGYTQMKGYIDGGDGQETTNLISVGAGLPIIAKNRVDLALEYGWQGTSASLLGKRSLLMLSVSFTIGEDWFIHPTED